MINHPSELAGDLACDPRLTWPWPRKKSQLAQALFDTAEQSGAPGISPAPFRSRAVPIRRLERELGTPLFTRTTRRVAMTSAGAELLARAKVILDEVAAADAAIRRVAAGEAGTVRLGITPPVASILAPT
jgi:hypothetical protein